jgi:DNA invertase Pin-like site-specific DNA recombinase
MRVALYVRRSTNERRQADSIPAQLALLRAFATREGHEIVDDSFADNASGRTAKRNGFQRLIEAVQAGPSFEAVLVRDVTR